MKLNRSMTRIKLHKTFFKPKNLIFGLLRFLRVLKKFLNLGFTNQFSSAGKIW